MTFDSKAPSFDPELEGLWSTKGPTAQSVRLSDSGEGGALGQDLPCAASVGGSTNPATSPVAFPGATPPLPEAVPLSRSTQSSGALGCYSEQRHPLYQKAGSHRGGKEHKKKVEEVLKVEGEEYVMEKFSTVQGTGQRGVAPCEEGVLR